MALVCRKLQPLALVVMLLLAPTSAYAQSSPAVALRIGGEVPNHLELSLADLAAFQHQTFHVVDEKGVQSDYSGVPVAEILRKAGAPLGKELKGQKMAMGVVARAPDGYHVLYSLTDFDPAFTDRVIIVADHRDSKTLDAREGPLRIIIPGDKRGARWIRGVTSLEVVSVK